MEDGLFSQVLAEDFAAALGEIEVGLSTPPDLTTHAGLIEHSGTMNRIALLAAACAERLRLMALMLEYSRAAASEIGLDPDAIMTEARQREHADKNRPTLTVVK